MVRRELLTAFGAGAAGLAVMGGFTAQAQDHAHHDKMHESCLKACRECATSCLEMFEHCFRKVAAGDKTHAKAAQLALDCSEFCELSARLIARQSPMMAMSCHACAEACKACGDECAKSTDPEMKACVAACRTCEASCRAMIKTMAHDHH
jgi:hypothetical protein